MNVSILKIQNTIKIKDRETSIEQDGMKIKTFTVKILQFLVFVSN